MLLLYIKLVCIFTHFLHFVQLTEHRIGFSDIPHCPILSYAEYLAKLNPDCHSLLLQRPKNFESEDYNP